MLVLWCLVLVTTSLSAPIAEKECKQFENPVPRYCQMSEDEESVWCPDVESTKALPSNAWNITNSLYIAECYEIDSILHRLEEMGLKRRPCCGLAPNTAIWKANGHPNTGSSSHIVLGTLLPLSILFVVSLAVVAYKCSQRKRKRNLSSTPEMAMTDLRALSSGSEETLFDRKSHDS